MTVNEEILVTVSIRLVYVFCNLIEDEIFKLVFSSMNNCFEKLTVIYKRKDFFIFQRFYSEHSDFILEGEILF